MRQRSLVTILNRFPRHPCSDIQAWKRQVKEREQYQAAAPRPQAVISARGHGLAAWLREHRYLRPVDVSAGESSMALLLLWEVDHGRAWPSHSSNRSGALAAFTKCLTQQGSLDDELKEWLIPKYSSRPLAPGLPDSHHSFWPVQVLRPPPAEPQGWYEDFVARWRT